MGVSFEQEALQPGKFGFCFASGDLQALETGGKI